MQNKENSNLFMLVENKLNLLFDNGVINYNEMGFIVFLVLKFTDKKDNVLKKSNGEICTQKDIMIASGLTKPTISKLMRGLINKNILSEEKHEEVINAKKYSISLQEIDKIIFELKSNPQEDSFLEKDLENILIKDLSIIEDGLTLIKNQYQVNNGYIDILAKDRNNKTCIIELKISKNDIKLIQQCVYYPTQFNEDVRMIAIAPDYNNKLYKSLKSLGYVEMKTYEINEENLLINNVE